MADLAPAVLGEMRALALQNAHKYGGKASQGAVMGKVLAAHPELKGRSAEIGKALAAILSEVNALPAEKQLAELERVAPELLVEKKKEQKRDLPELEGAEQGKVVTRIPPEPSKYAHIGHAYSFLVNYLYAKKYAGRCILKFEDTNPEKCTQEYVDAMTEDITGYLRIDPSEVMLVSDDLPAMYGLAQGLISKRKAYVCTCVRERMQELRHRGEGCEHRRAQADENLALWKDMLAGKFAAGDAVLRLAGDMAADNQVMRDPVLFRISMARHFRHGTTYRVWPLYDFENAVGDALHGVTHIMRSSEFGTMRNELQNRLKDLLGFPKQVIVHYGRVNITGSLTKGREIREKIASGEMRGWDDPRLVTLKALKRRGIQPEAIHEFVLQAGMSPAETNIDFSVIAALNRKLLDARATRFFFIAHPERVRIEGAPRVEVRLRKHPDFPERGYRAHTTGEEFLLEKADLDSLREGELYRLMDCLNFTKEGRHLVFHSLEHEKYRESGKRIIHWLPANERLLDVEVMMPDATTLHGKGEPGMAEARVDEVVQAERFGFMRLDAKSATRLSFWYSHK